MNKTEDDELDAQALSEEELRQISGRFSAIIKSVHPDIIEKLSCHFSCACFYLSQRMTSTKN